MFVPLKAWRRCQRIPWWWSVFSHEACFDLPMRRITRRISVPVQRKNSFPVKDSIIPSPHTPFRGCGLDRVLVQDTVQAWTGLSSRSRFLGLNLDGESDQASLTDIRLDGASPPQDTSHLLHRVRGNPADCRRIPHGLPSLQLTDHLGVFLQQRFS